MKQQRSGNDILRTMRFAIVLFSLFTLALTFAFTAKTTMTKYVLSDELALNVSSGWWLNSVSIELTGNPSGGPNVGQNVQLIAIDPDTAADQVNYQWERSTASGFEPIGSSTTAPTVYTLAESDVGQSVRLTVTGRSGTVYEGFSVSSNLIGPVTGNQTSLAWIVSENDPIMVDTHLQAVHPTITDYLLSYRWEYSDNPDSGYQPASGGYHGGIYLHPDSIGKYIRLILTYGSNYAVVTTEPVGPVYPYGFAVNLAQDAVGNIVRSFDFGGTGGGSPLTQWFRVNSLTNESNLIAGNVSQYTPSPADAGHFLKVIATGEVNSIYNTWVAEKSIPILKPYIIYAQPGVPVLSIDRVEAPVGAGYTLQWQYAAWNSSQNQGFTNIAGQTGHSYQLQPGDVGKYIRVAAISTETGMMFGSNSFSPIVYAAISGTPLIGQTLSASVTPSYNNAYQWQRSSASNPAVFADISGATGNQYTIAQGNEGFSFRLKVTHNGAVCYSNVIGPVPSTMITRESLMVESGDLLAQLPSDKMPEMSDKPEPVDSWKLTATAEPAAEPMATFDPDVTPIVEPIATPVPTGEPVSDPKTLPEPIMVPSAEPKAIPDPTEEPAAEPTMTPTPTVAMKAEQTVKQALAAELTAIPAPTTEPTATPAPTAEPTATPAPTAEQIATPALIADPTVTPAPTAEPTATPAPTSEPTAEPTATLEPQPFSLTITAASARKAYDGSALIANEFTTDRSLLMPGHTLTAQAEGSLTQAGTAENRIVSYTIRDASGQDVSGMYEVSFESGILTVDVNPVKIDIIPASARKVYDGSPLSDSGYTLSFRTAALGVIKLKPDNSYELSTGDILEAKTAGSITEVGTADNIVSMFRVTTRAGVDVTHCYTFENRFSSGILEVTAPPATPTPVPTSVPTPVPTSVPTPVPTSVPTTLPTPAPTLVPTPAPTAVPTPATTTVATPAPTLVPTSAPTPEPQDEPTPESTP